MPAPSSQSSWILQEGDQIRNTYTVERVLGQGAFGQVYRVRHRFLGRQAMKVFKLPDMTLGEAQDLLGEALLLSTLGHPNIIRVFDADVTETPSGRFAYFTMEYVAGGSLFDYWKGFGARFVPAEESVRIATQICRGLNVAHSANPPIVHRDIKPHNILVGYTEAGLQVRIADFGLAKRANPLTLLVSGKGTLAFKPPEIFDDVKSDSRAGDIWAIGECLYLMLTDRLPYQNPGDTGVPGQQAQGASLVPASELNPLVDRHLDSITSKALQPDPGKRYPHAAAMLRDLESWNPSKNEKVGDILSSMSKSALGTCTPLISQRAALSRIQEAKEIAKDIAQLPTAADILEIALRDCPDLRDQYQYLLQLWRRGIMM